MSTIVRRKRISARNKIGPYKRAELLTGEIFYPVEGYSGYGDGRGTILEAFIGNQMKADWVANRDELLEFWRSGKYTTEWTAFADDNLPWIFFRGSGARPWAAKVFDRQFGAVK